MLETNTVHIPSISKSSTQSSKYVPDHALPPPAAEAIPSRHHLVPGLHALILAPLKVILQWKCDLKKKSNLVSPLLKTFLLLFTSLQLYLKTLSWPTRLDLIWLGFLSDLISHSQSPYCSANVSSPLPQSFECSFLSVQITSGRLLCRSAQTPLPQRSHSHSSHTKCSPQLLYITPSSKCSSQNSICFAYFPVLSSSLLLLWELNCYGRNQVDGKRQTICTPRFRKGLFIPILPGIWESSRSCTKICSAPPSPKPAALG